MMGFDGMEIPGMEEYAAGKVGAFLYYTLTREGADPVSGYMWFMEITDTLEEELKQDARRVLKMERGDVLEYTLFGIVSHVRI